MLSYRESAWAAPSAATEDDTPTRSHRPALSCVQCRRRKIKCDRNVPCGPCSRAKNASFCLYRPGTISGVAAAAAGPTSTDETRRLQLEGSFVTSPAAPLPFDSTVSLDQNSTAGNSVLWASDDHSSSQLASTGSPGGLGLGSRICVSGVGANHPYGNNSQVHSLPLEQYVQELSDHVHKVQHLLLSVSALGQIPSGRVHTLEQTVTIYRTRCKQQSNSYRRDLPSNKHHGGREAVIFSVPQQSHACNRLRQDMIFGRSYWLHTLEQV
jgi:hypothetical protein